jgi:L-alanine-DL-glutamate epimerase-like enolase superfamily enzyme
MQITKIEPIVADFPLIRPIKMSGVEIGISENVLVRVETDNGLVGWGEVSSSPSMTGETVESMVAALRFMAPFLVGCDPSAFAENLDEMDWRMYGNTSAKTVLEMACYDLTGKAQQKSIAELLGGARRGAMPVVQMLATGDLETDLADARSKADEGFVAMKIKVGGKPVAEDIERTNAISKALNGAVQLSADANQGWHRDDGLAFARGASAALDFLEQPVMGRDVEGMAMIAGESACSISADEGLHSFEDIRRHHNAGAAHGGSLKTIKLGGLTRAFQATELFAELGMNVNLAGKTAETSVGSAAILHIAAAAPDLAWGVSPTAPYLAVDIVRNPIKVQGGHVEAPSGAGLGVEVDEDALAKYVRSI